MIRVRRRQKQFCRTQRRKALYSLILKKGNYAFSRTIDRNFWRLEVTVMELFGKAFIPEWFAFARFSLTLWPENALGE